jgi:hypothetical protein
MSMMMREEYDKALDALSKEWATFGDRLVDRGYPSHLVWLSMLMFVFDPKGGGGPLPTDDGPGVASFIYMWGPENIFWKKSRGDWGAAPPRTVQAISETSQRATQLIGTSSSRGSAP